MIGSALKYIGDDIEALDWVEVYGGLVQTVKIRQPDSNNDVYNIFPISCDVSEEDCNTNQRYQDLIPNSNKRSIVYFEQLTGLVDRGGVRIGNSTNRFRRVYTGTVRLVCWLNMQLLGVNECYGSDIYMRSLLKILYQDLNSNNFPDDSIFKNGDIQIKVQQFVPKDYRVIFGKYNYLESTGYWMYPYDYFAIDLAITITLPLCDFDAPTPPVNPDECIDYSKIL